MSSSNGSGRLDRIEALLENVSHRVDSNARAIQANTESINVVAEVVGRSARTVEILAQAVEEDRGNFQEYRQRNDAQLASLNAAVERLDAIVDYLVRRDQRGQDA